MNAFIRKKHMLVSAESSSVLSVLTKHCQTGLQACCVISANATYLCFEPYTPVRLLGWNKCVVYGSSSTRITCIFNSSDCYFQYIHPGDSHKLGQAELVCIDEAAAIPLPLVKKLLGPYLVFMSSTVNGFV